ncbi:flagellar protein FlaG [Caldisalinibacter kiritimatiensis]|uniref:Flagellin n=1 Tax=Caldisalinibacter kiritimatiensis TaxID=1304284 RepID=R1CNV0_9FIRM|nr:flagellar protein FlaG [Caldisalinibacter kiritimatiensis]EOD00376.1 Flagellin [Caldisalinibacter kiritimatiensis]
MRIDGVSSTSTIQRPQQVTTGDVNINKQKEDIKNIEQAALPTNKNEDKKFTEEELINAIEKANKGVKIYDRKLEFSIHEKTKEIMVKVIDTSTDEVIREIPPEKILDMVAKMWELAGILVDEKA